MERLVEFPYVQQEGDAYVVPTQELPLDGLIQRLFYFDFELADRLIDRSIARLDCSTVRAYVVVFFFFLLLLFFILSASGRTYSFVYRRLASSPGISLSLSLSIFFFCYIGVYRESARNRSAITVRLEYRTTYVLIYWSRSYFVLNFNHRSN